MKPNQLKRIKFADLKVGDHFFIDQMWYRKTGHTTGVNEDFMPVVRWHIEMMPDGFVEIKA